MAFIFITKQTYKTEIIFNVNPNIYPYNDIVKGLASAQNVDAKFLSDKITLSFYHKNAENADEFANAFVNKIEQKFLLIRDNDKTQMSDFIYACVEKTKSDSLIDAKTREKILDNFLIAKNKILLYYDEKNEPTLLVNSVKTVKTNKFIEKINKIRRQ